MSSVIVKGMQIPSNCGWCPLCRYFSSTGITKCMLMQTPLAEDYKDIRFDSRHENCPLAELPEKHGDLIDRDALVKDLTNGIKAGLLLDGYEEYPNINNADDCVECVKYADAVIEAEGRDT